MKDRNMKQVVLTEGISERIMEDDMVDVLSKHVWCNIKTYWSYFKKGNRVGGRIMEGIICVYMQMSQWTNLCN
jgi:hypothetical protein